ncbi:helix-turn-helix domain-containing protein [Gracilibacillus phocaeensis]|uniref:helix-turn-helix domain-containing protein n=1 Tax=Gracilibacillus phocaeensis TaxID=2042304 RepID=UPI00103273CD|nr:helix-turn-helix domain-containing protein [Gracilibacillus phocaeensis]
MLYNIIKKKDESFQFKSKSDLVNLSSAIENLYLEHDDLNSKYYKQEPLVRDQCLTLLLKGQSTTVYPPKELFDSLELDLSGPYAFVIVTAFSQEQLRVIDMKKVETTASQLMKNTKVYGVELINDKVIAYIVNGLVDSKAKKNMFLTQFQTLIPFDNFSCIGVSKTYSGTNSMNHSFIEAFASFEYGKANQVKGIVHFDEIKKQQETMWLPNTDLLKLTQSCKQGNKEIADETIQSLVYWLQHSAPPPLLKYMKYDLVNTLIKITSETGISLDIQKIYFQMNNENWYHFQTSLFELTGEICDKISEKKETQKDQLQVDIIEYIHNNFKDQNFSLDNIAKDFNLSISYLSRFIKEKTSKTFSQYVWELRLKEVKKQLVETSVPIKEIIIEIGYIDPPSFTRKFKSSVGLTPSEYRYTYQKNS